MSKKIILRDRLITLLSLYLRRKTSPQTLFYKPLKYWPNMPDKKLEYIEDKYGLSVAIRWFTPMAYFLLFFCIAWDSFLIFWYTSVIGAGAPWIFAVFPMVHLAVGIGLTYYTFCLFFNKTYVDVMDGYLDVRHAPIPWWKGNVHLSTNDIEQIYVKEVISSNNNTTTRYYGLHAKMVDGLDEKLLNVGGLDAQQAKELEHRLEAYIGIDDRPVVGEYHGGIVKDQLPQPRRQRRTDYQSPLSFLYALNIGENINFLENDYQIRHISQFDWNDGDSDKSLQLLDSQQQETLLYIQKNRSLVQAFREEKIPLYESNQIAFRTIQPHTAITFKNQQYLLDSHSTGEAFLSDTGEPLKAEQWIYLNQESMERIRIVNFQNQITFYQGTKAEEQQFEKTEDQLNLRELDINYDRLDDDEDYV